MLTKLAKPLTILILSLALLAGPVMAAEITSLGDAINQAGRQRMLSQRIVRAYSQILLNADPDIAKKQLKGALSLFQVQLDNLKAYSPSATISTDLDEVDALWQPFRQAAEADITDEGLNMLVDINEALLAAAHKVVLDLEARSTTPAGRLVNIAGRQRMLSQRMGKFYMLHAYGIRNETIHAGLIKAIAEFQQAHTELKEAPLNTRQIRDGLTQVEKAWKVLNSTFSSLESGIYSPLTVAIYTENVLQQMNSITGQYATLSTD